MIQLSNNHNYYDYYDDEEVVKPVTLDYWLTTSVLIDIQHSVSSLYISMKKEKKPENENKTNKSVEHWRIFLIVTRFVLFLFRNSFTFNQLSTEFQCSCRWLSLHIFNKFEFFVS